MQIYHKAYVYLTCGPELLVLEEPDHPHIGFQVPGGTLDPGESYLQGALREFAEETGLSPNIALEAFADQDQLVKNEPRTLAGLHRRKHFHASLRKKPRTEWEHFEMTPSAGGPPIRLRLFWVDLFAGTVPLQDRFFLGFGAQLETLRPRMERHINESH